MKTKLASLSLVLVLSLAAAANAGPVLFQKIVVDSTFRAEGVATADINHDGALDIFAGDVWYEAAAPKLTKWKMHQIRKLGEYDGTKGYSQTFANFAQDINGDGWIDSIIIGMPGEPCRWYENPKNKPGHWKERIIVNSACNETPIFPDLLDDGRKALIFAVRPQGIMAWFSIPAALDGLWDLHVIAGPAAPGTERYSHGLGAGDVNGDGRKDVLVKQGWWEAPQDRTTAKWNFHPANLGQDCANMIVYDVDDDGDPDVISSSAHNYGIWWHEQLPPADGSKFQQHLISKEYSQPHAIILADVNNDGLMDLVTGKRHFAHQGRDPGGKDPAMLYWLELRRQENSKPQFIMHVIDDDSGVGTQFEVLDFNDDGKLDIVTSNKKGTHLFLQKP